MLKNLDDTSTEALVKQFDDLSKQIPIVSEHMQQAETERNKWADKYTEMCGMAYHLKTELRKRKAGK